MLKGQKRKTKFNTLTPAKIDHEMGIEARSFDTTIENMNRKYLSKINYTYLTPSCLLPLAFCPSLLGN
jgi:hypothetical protein